MPTFPAIRISVMLALCASAALAPRPAHAEISMGAISQCSAGADLAVQYQNLTPDYWDLRGYGMAIDSVSVAGRFAQQPGGGYLVAPGAIALANKAGCDTLTGRPKRKQVSVKIGSCKEPEPMALPSGMDCSGLATGADFYSAGACVRDSVGRGLAYGNGGLLDTWAGRTQIQVSASALFPWKGAQARFDPASMGGPFWMMSMAALQEFIQVDMQALLALGASASGAGLVDAQGASLYSSPANTGIDTDPYGSFRLTYLTAGGRLFTEYPGYFPANPSLAALVAPGGAGPTPPNTVHHVNSGFLAALNLWWFFDGLSASADFCFRDFLFRAADKRAALKLILTGYLYGPNIVDRNTGADDYATHVLPASYMALAAADITPFLKRNPWGAGTPDSANHNPLLRIVSILDAITAANVSGAPCGGSLAVYDAGISLTQVRQLFFGEGGTAALQGGGGLLHHYSLATAARAALSAELDCAFGRLKGRAPGRGPEEISFRYDFLSLLRVARAHFPAQLDKSKHKPAPADTFSSEYAIWVFSHGRKPCIPIGPDVGFPYLYLADTLFRPGQKVELSAHDDRGIRLREYTTDTDWRAWSPATPQFTVPSGMAAGARLWYRVQDSCGNAVIEEALLSGGTVPVAKAAIGDGGIRALGNGKFLAAPGARSIAAYDALGIFLGWARPLDGGGQWALPGMRGAAMVEIRWANGGATRHLLPR